MTDKTVLADFILEARKGGKKKGKNGKSDSAKRSRFLGVVMKHLSSDRGKAMANAIESQDLAGFKDLWNKATNAIIGDLEVKFGKAENKPQTEEKPDAKPAV